MFFHPLLFCGVLLLLSCNNAATIKEDTIPTVTTNKKNSYPFIKNIPLPEGFARIPADSNSFAAWLRNRALKETNTVHLYNGREKRNQQAQFAVLDIPVGDKDLQQCADAVMRLRAEYLFSQKRFAEILFYDNDKTAYLFSAPFTHEHFTHYLEQVFSHCGSASLSQQLHHKNDLAAIAPGDVLIRGGFPGHAVMVTDVAADSSGKKIFLLAQSYMPAQDIHILKTHCSQTGCPGTK